MRLLLLAWAGSECDFCVAFLESVIGRCCPLGAECTNFEACQLDYQTDCAAARADVPLAPHAGGYNASSTVRAQAPLRTTLYAGLSGAERERVWDAHCFRAFEAMSQLGAVFEHVAKALPHDLAARRVLLQEACHAHVTDTFECKRPGEFFTQRFRQAQAERACELLGRPAFVTRTMCPKPDGVLQLERLAGARPPIDAGREMRELLRHYEERTRRAAEREADFGDDEALEERLNGEEQARTGADAPAIELRGDACCCRQGSCDEAQERASMAVFHRGEDVCCRRFASACEDPTAPRSYAAQRGPDYCDPVLESDGAVAFPELRLVFDDAKGHWRVDAQDYDAYPELQSVLDTIWDPDLHAFLRRTPGFAAKLLMEQAAILLGHPRGYWYVENVPSSVRRMLQVAYAEPVATPPRHVLRMSGALVASDEEVRRQADARRGRVAAASQATWLGSALRAFSAPVRAFSAPVRASSAAVRGLGNAVMRTARGDFQMLEMMTLAAGSTFAHPRTKDANIRAYVDHYRPDLTVVERLACTAERAAAGQPCCASGQDCTRLAQRAFKTYNEFFYRRLLPTSRAFLCYGPRVEYCTQPELCAPRPQLTKEQAEELGFPDVGDYVAACDQRTVDLTDLTTFEADAAAKQAFCAAEGCLYVAEAMSRDPDGGPRSAAAVRLDHKRSLVSPADARVMVVDLSKETTLWVKGEEFDLRSIVALPSDDAYNYYLGGHAFVVRLSPQDYHRFHFPCDGTVCEQKHYPGRYYSVNPMAVQSSETPVFSTNKRMHATVQSDEFGCVLYVSVGATMVGSVVHSSYPGQRVVKGMEHGYMAFGGSTVIIVVPPGVQIDPRIEENSRLGVETLVQVGDVLGRAGGDAFDDPERFPPDALQRLATQLGGVPALESVDAAGVVRRTTATPAQVRRLRERLTPPCAYAPACGGQAAPPAGLHAVLEDSPICTFACAGAAAGAPLYGLVNNEFHDTPCASLADRVVSCPGGAPEVALPAGLAAPAPDPVPYARAEVGAPWAGSNRSSATVVPLFAVREAEARWAASRWAYGRPLAMLSGEERARLVRVAN